MLESYRILFEKKLDRSFKILAKNIKNLAIISEFYPESTIIRKFLIEQCESNFEYLQYED